MSSPRTTTESLLGQAERFLPAGVTSTNRAIDPPIAFRRAAGAYIEDVEGRRYLDYHAAFGPIILGHCHPPVTERVAAVLRETDLYGVGTTELEVRLAEKLIHHVPSIEQVLLCNSGSEATYAAVRLARAVTGRSRILKFQGCYHGWHDAVFRNVISPADRVGEFDPGSAGMAPEVVRNTLVCRFNDLEDVNQTVRRYQGEVAAVILEPIPHNIGCVLPEPGFLEGLRRLCDREGIILIFDEVVTGFRHHLGGYQAICGVIPDLTTLGKAMANGYPIAALGGRRDLMARFNPRAGGDVFFAGTFNGHAAAVAASLVTIELLEGGGVYEHLYRLGDRMRAGLRDIAGRAGIPATVAGFGSVYLLYFLDGPIRSYNDLMRNHAHRFVRYRRELLTRGIFELPVNLKRNHISFSHTDDEISRTLEAAEDALRAVLREDGQG